MIIDAAAYIDGQRVDIDQSNGVLPAGVVPSNGADVADDPDEDPRWNDRAHFIWLGLRMPSIEELSSWCDKLQLHDIDPAEVLTPHARPVLSVSGDTAQLVLRTVHYDDRKEIAVLGEITMLASPYAIVTIRHGHTSPLRELRASLECSPAQLRRGVTGVMAAVIGRVLDDYGPALDGFETDAVQVEGEVFSDTRRQPVQRLYRLKRELRRMLVAIEALEDPLERMIRVLGPNVAREVLADLNENADQLRRTVRRAQSLSNLLDATLTASLTQVSVQQNDDMRKISAWVAMAAVPTMVAGIYGMNFENMPELEWHLGYPLILALMGGAVALLYRSFKKSGWL